MDNTVVSHLSGLAGYNAGGGGLSYYLRSENHTLPIEEYFFITVNENTLRQISQGCLIKLCRQGLVESQFVQMNSSGHDMVAEEVRDRVFGYVPQLSERLVCRCEDRVIFILAQKLN